MKKQLLVFSALVLAASVQAQITITSADVVVPPKTVYQSNDTLPTVTVGSGGASQTWNMTALATHTTDTLGFMPIAWAPDAAEFPTGNMALTFGTSGNFGYLLNGAGGLDILGNGATIDIGAGPTHVVIHNQPAERMMAFPSTYNTNFTNDYGSLAVLYFGIDPGIGFTVDSVMMKSMIHKTSLVDGWGTITTPLGTFPALRTVQMKYQTDSLFGYIGLFSSWNFFQEQIDSTKTYSWWTNSVGFPLVSADVDWTTNAPTRVQWLQATPAVGINEYTAAEQLNAYPNPANEQMTMELDPSVVNSVMIYDLSGRLVETYSVQNDRLIIDTGKLKPGMYTYQANRTDGSLANRGKFSVVR